jgi:hypothetical protein
VIRFDCKSARSVPKNAERNGRYKSGPFRLFWFS